MVSNLNKKEGPVWEGSIGDLVLVHSRAVTDPTAQHHGEDHLKDLHR